MIFDIAVALFALALAVIGYRRGFSGAVEAVASTGGQIMPPIMGAAAFVMAEGRHCEPGCDPMDENSCGGEGRRCLSLQDEDMNPLGDFCFEPCGEEPNDCPQGYQCVDLEDQDGNPMGNLCIRRCDLDPFR